MGGQNGIFARACRTSAVSRRSADRGIHAKRRRDGLVVQPVGATSRGTDRAATTILVWLACWDCRERSVLNYAPSSAPLRTQDGGEIVGQFATLALGFAAFQIFTVDYVAATRYEAELWNSRPPPSIRPAVLPIWPHLLGAGPISWPPAVFANGDFDRLVSWDSALRRGVALLN